MRRLLSCSALAGICLLLISGCGKDTATDVSTPPPKKMKVSSAAPAQEIKPIADEVKQAPSVYVYDPAGMRDPFEALVMVRKPVFQDENEPLTPLQRYDLSQFRLSAVVVGKGKPTAMVVAPGGKAYLLAEGTKIGKNGGVVSKVTPESVLVQEKYYDFTGNLSSTTQEIRFTQKAGDE